MVRYTVLRLLIFFGCVAVLWLAGLRDRADLLLLVASAALLSAVISYFALRRFREEYSAQLAEKIEKRTEAKRAAAAVVPTDEDAEDAETAGDEGTFR
jgi:Protein of unknown function (DUF4229)